MRNSPYKDCAAKCLYYLMTKSYMQFRQYSELMIANIPTFLVKYICSGYNIHMKPVKEEACYEELP